MLEDLSQAERLRRVLAATPTAPVPQPLVYDLVIMVYGRPGPQGSKSSFGKFGMQESSPYVKPWREAVKAAAIEKLQWLGARAPMFDGPVAVRYIETRIRPKSHPKGTRTWPTGVPDLSKTWRATEDALSEAGVWVDDSRVVEYDRMAKVWSTACLYGDDPEAIDRQGALICVRGIGQGRLL